MRVCLIGAGGAAKGLLAALPGEVRVFSRSGEVTQRPEDFAAILRRSRH